MYVDTLGRFLQQDPSQYVNGPNRYQVDVASPTSRVDPAGTATQPVTTQPVTTQPVTTQPVTTQPVTTQPVTTQPTLPYRARVIPGGFQIVYNGPGSPTFRQLVHIELPPGAGPSQEELDEHNGQDSTAGYVPDNGSGDPANAYGTDENGQGIGQRAGNGGEVNHPNRMTDTPGHVYHADPSPCGPGVTYQVAKDFYTEIYDNNGILIGTVHWSMSKIGLIKIIEEF